MTSTCGQNGGSKFEKSLTGKLIRYASNQEYIFFFEVPAPRQMTSQNYPPGLGGQIPITEFCYEVFFIRFKKSNSNENCGKLNVLDLAIFAKFTDSRP